jgi:hypothetical protein
MIASEGVNDDATGVLTGKPTQQEEDCPPAGQVERGKSKGKSMT